VRDKKAVSEASLLLPEAFSTIDILINNAGNAHGLDPIQNGDLDDWDAMIDINVKGLLYVSKAIIHK
jgi:NADP-dependent 3-hydroxy acid dehydrogenase YdfG